jgi:AraC family transcriptional regulator, transcriptional activator of pobA
MENPVMAQPGESHTFDLKVKRFKVYEIETDVHPLPTYDRDFYKISVLNGKSNINYAGRSIMVDGPYLFFGNPHIRYSSELLSPGLTGFSCLFREEFLVSNERSENIPGSSLFKIGGTPVLPLTAQQFESISTIYKKMLADQNSDYIFKEDLIRNYLHLVIHEALKMAPPVSFNKHRNASSRIAATFFDLLENQFPIYNPEHPLRLKTAQDYAQNLAVHVNHLNRAVREITARPTTAHIAERVTHEAKSLLRHTDWSISDIAYSLGFEHLTHFNHYFKRLTGTTPGAFRLQSV